MRESNASTGYVVKVLYDNIAVEPRWVMAGSGRGLVSRENATVFPDRQAAMAEAKIWKALATSDFSIIVENA